MKYIISYTESDYIKFNKKFTPSHFVDLKISCARHADGIIILFKCLKKHIRDVQRWLIHFLVQKSITTKNALVFRGKLFKPNSFLKYFDFKLIYSDLNKLNFNKDKYVQLRYTSTATRLETMFSSYLGRSFCVLIQNSCVKSLKNRLKAQLSKKNSR
jgi:hypothetical protein